LLRILKAGFVSFAVVFGAGFVLGTIRTLWIVPRTGARTAELMEAPVMLVVSFFAARWIVRRFELNTCGRQFRVGIFALALLLLAEFSLVIRLRGLTIRDYVATRDPVAGTAYSLSLGLFACMPLLVRRRRILRAG
jgi:hypothetical protein